MSRKKAIEAFRAGPGAAKSGLLEENRVRLRGSKRRAKELGLGINGAKRDLDALKHRVEELAVQRQSQAGEEGAGQVLGPEEYSSLMRIKDLKLMYREQFSELQMVGRDRHHPCYTV